MTHTEALQLAEKISRTWRGHITLDIWTETLEPLNHSRAEQAWQALRDSEQSQPSVAQFRARYIALNAPQVAPSDSFNPHAGADAAATFVAVKGTGVRPLAELADECFAAAEAYRNASQKSLF